MKKKKAFVSTQRRFYFDAFSSVLPWKPPTLISLTGLLGSGRVAVADISVFFSSQGLFDRVLLAPGPTCWCRR